MSELLRNQLATEIQNAQLSALPLGTDVYPDACTAAADAILSRFDVRLREPQAEEWDQRVPTTETQARWAYDRILDVYATVEGTELTDNRWGQVLTDLGELMKRLDAIDRSGRREPQAEET